MSTYWYLYKDGQQQGPFSWEELYRQAEAGLFGPADLVWTEGMENWSRADQVKGLLEMIPPPPPSEVYTEPLASAPSYQLENQRIARSLSQRSKGRGSFVAPIIILTIAILVGAFIVFKIFFFNGENVIISGFLSLFDKTDKQAEEELEEAFEEKLDIDDVAKRVYGNVEVSEEIEEMVQHLINGGIEVEEFRNVFYEAVDASSGVGILVEDVLIHLFYYCPDKTDPEMLSNLEEYHDPGGIQPVLVNGFYMADINVYPDKEKFIEVFMSF